MTNTKLSALVAQAVALDREISEKSALLNDLKDQLSVEAESRCDESTPTEGGGTSITFEGGDGCIARVTTSGPALKSSIKAEGRDIEKVKPAAGRHFLRLFEQVLAYKPVANFREQAESLLGAKDAGKLIKLCTNPGKTSVSFETKEAVPAA